MAKSLRCRSCKKFGPRYRTAHLTADLPCNVDHGIIGLMDPAHGPFVHQAWWWRSRASIREKTKRFEPIPEGFRMSAHAPSGNSAPYKLLGVYGQPIETTIDFVLPNRRTEMIRCGDKWFSSLTTVTPVTASTCRIDVVAAWNVFYYVPLVTPIAKFFGAKFVRQDQVTMIQQAEGLRHNPSLMLIDDADKPAKWYFALKQARLDAAGGAAAEASDGWAGGAALAELRCFDFLFLRSRERFNRTISEARMGRPANSEVPVTPRGPASTAMRSNPCTPAATIFVIPTEFETWGA